MIADSQKTIVLVGHGMVGHRFCERMVELDTGCRYRIVTFCEEPRAAYDRVGLTSFFAHRDAEQLMLARLAWYREQGIELHIGDRAARIDRDNRVVHSDTGSEIAYDHVVLATGSYPFVPPVPGIEKVGVFVYRTIEDLERIIEYAGSAKSAAVLGGGLLGLEAAKATLDLGLKTHVVEFAPRLMPRQVDDAGSTILRRKIEELGVHVHLAMQSEEVLGNGKVEGLRFTDSTVLDVDMLVVSAGIRPRDDLARACGLDVGERGGVIIDDACRTNDPHIHAIGEVALHRNMIYGLVAPGYEMAETLAANFCGESRSFTGGDLSAKLKLMGVDVASFGDHEASDEGAVALTHGDPLGGVYKKLLFNQAGDRLLGGILVGDADDYGLLLGLWRAGEPLSMSPGDLLRGSSGSALDSAGSMPEDAQVCSCNNVSKGEICAAIREHDLASPDAVKSCTSAGAGCGGCLALVTRIFKQAMKDTGVEVKNNLCEHFDLTRQELFDLVRVRRYRTFGDVIESCGSGLGCEVCKPTVASMLASLWNEHILEHDVIQDTNDRFLANIQRGGLYSVVPRVPGGEITPDKLIALGRIAKKYRLYSKITGGQRIDLFGARVDQLPDIWEELIEAGFESGHAYGKAMRTVKSCVGSTWCRYGVQDSVGFAIRVEERYRGLRAPHKLKSAVSGCTRECAEAQCKDFGIIATENGWNLYVCGNGGARPRHADLLATDIDEDTCIRYIDRFLMFYIRTADKLTRTATWIEQLDGGIDYLRDVVVEDSLGIAEELGREMQAQVDTYQCEWKTVVEDPRKRAMFTHFANSEDPDKAIEWVSERGQWRPRDWARDRLPPRDRTGAKAMRPKRQWIAVGPSDRFPVDGGTAIKHGEHQIAVFNFETRGEWYAVQNMCPHQRDMVLARGIVGDARGEPKVACPMHKKTFSLVSGEGLSDPSYCVETFPVKVVDDMVFVELPPAEQPAAATACRHAPKNAPAEGVAS